jgi:glucosamine--fructose-6-phosphate aminotransferase (isomerizing)
MQAQCWNTLKEVVYVNDYELAIIKPDELILKKSGQRKDHAFVTKLDMELAAIEKGGYDHFMLKEIFEQPTTIHDCLTGTHRRSSKAS